MIEQLLDMIDGPYAVIAKQIHPGDDLQVSVRPEGRATDQFLPLFISK